MFIWILFLFYSQSCYDNYNYCFDLFDRYDFCNKDDCCKLNSDNEYIPNWNCTSKYKYDCLNHDFGSCPGGCCAFSFTGNYCSPSGECNERKVNVGAIVGGILGGLVFIGAIIFVTICCLCSMCPLY
jgi:hypothetical protein